MLNKKKIEESQLTQLLSMPYAIFRDKLYI